MTELKSPSPVDILQTIAVFQGVETRRLNRLARDARSLAVPGGVTIVRPGDPTEAVYVVRSGALAVFEQGLDGRRRQVAILRAGEMAGETAFAAGAAKHSRALVALRDTEILILPSKAFGRAVQGSANLAVNLARLIARRQRAERLNLAFAPQSFAVLVYGDLAPARAVLDTLVAALQDCGRAACVIDARARLETSTWFDAIERNHHAVFYLADARLSEWSDRARRQADRLIVVGYADVAPPFRSFKSIRPQGAMEGILDLVLFRARSRASSLAHRWSDAVRPDRLFTLTEGNSADVARLARMAAGRAVSLVLSGGGARAYAHIGALRALRSRGVPLDFLGGSSMGAVIAASVAMGWTDDEIDDRMRDAFVRSNPVNDFTLPVVALVRGAKVDQRLKRHFGDVRIEDLDRPFFCVSANLTTGEPVIHRTGLLRSALRKSLAIPGLLPPVIAEDGVHVDGAVMKTFPLDVMRETHIGPVLGCDVSRDAGLDPNEFANPPTFLEWMLRRGPRATPPIAQVLFRAANAMPAAERQGQYDHADLVISPEIPDASMRDWRNYETVVEAGFRATETALLETRPTLGRWLSASKPR
ncbi:MAG: patatin-like phospholipase family protein [Maricaulaceae bacterium]